VEAQPLWGTADAIKAFRPGAGYVGLISTPSGIASNKITSAIAKQRSARLHRFQSAIQSRIMTVPPGHSQHPGWDMLMTGQRDKNSTKVWLCDDKETVISPQVLTRKYGEKDV
jgi:hypothetical protein